MIAAYFFTSPSKLIFPSWIRTTRFASRAMELSWVIMTIVFSSSLSFFKKSSTSRPVLESRAPVGCVKLVQNKEPRQGCCLPGSSLTLPLCLVRLLLSLFVGQPCIWCRCILLSKSPRTSSVIFPLFLLLRLPGLVVCAVQ